MTTKFPRRCISGVALLALALTVTCAKQPPPPQVSQVTLTAATMSMAPAAMPRVGAVDDRYQSYNVEMAEVVGASSWRPYAALEAGQSADLLEKRGPIDLSNARLRKLAAALGPAYVRVSGAWANTVYFHDSDDLPPAEPPAGFQSVLTRSEWKGVVDFARASRAAIVTSFTMSAGVRDAKGVWTPEQAERLILFTRSANSEIAAAELFNEPSFAALGGAPPGYDAAAFARDFAVFRAFAERAAPKMKIVGPGSVGETVKLAPGPMLETADLLSASPKPEVDVFSYHFYGAASARCTSTMPGLTGTTPDAALSEQWLSQTDRAADFYRSLRDRFEPGKPIWVTETADAACGGNPWAPTFRDTFRYVDQLGRLAKRDVKVVFHNTLASSESGLVDQVTLTPRPDYWGALLWRKLMGSTVLDAGASKGPLHVYAHCMRDRPGGVTVLAINTGSAPESLDVAGSALRYTLSAKKLEDGRVQLNGHDLAVGANGDVPALGGVRTAAGRVVLAPTTITFLAFGDASNPSCR